MSGRAAGTVHVVGAGIAGLSAAVMLAESGIRTVLYEAAGQAGGRCRSYDDAVLGCRIDNGTHVLVGANQAAFRFLGRIGALDRLAALGADGVPFIDLGTAERWRARIGGGAFPWWVALRSRRIPGTGAHEYFRLYRLFGAPADATVAGCLGNGPLMDRLWRPLTEAALNTAPHEASARLLVPVVRGLLLGGPDSARIHVAAAGLGDTFVAPALARLARAGTVPRFGARLRAIERDEGRVTSLGFDGAEVPCGPSDAVILAVPGHVAATLVAGLGVPRGFRPIVNVHFRLDAEPPGPEPLVGVIGGAAHWFHRRGPILSATISA
ncbi:MAG: FAD-dependent oxidoreductase, partial [Alphaproteobacteria bacterium]